MLGCREMICTFLFRLHSARQEVRWLFDVSLGCQNHVLMLATIGLTFIGSSVGTEDQLADLLQAAADGKVAPSIEVFDFSAVPTLIAKLGDDGITGRAVVTLPQ